MPVGRLWITCVCGLMLACLLSVSAMAGQRWSPLAAGRRPVEVQHFTSSPPGSFVYPNFQQPYGPMPAPAYQWGWFGARYKPTVVDHRGYYGDRSTTIYPRGF